MATSYTGRIGTDGQYVDLATESGVTFTSGTTYTIQIQNLAYLKLGDAEFAIYTNDPFTYTAGSDTLYIKTTYNTCVVTILQAA